MRPRWLYGDHFRRIVRATPPTFGRNRSLSGHVSAHVEDTGRRSGGASRFPATSAHTMKTPATCRYEWWSGDHPGRHVGREGTGARRWSGLKRAAATAFGHLELPRTLAAASVPRAPTGRDGVAVVAGLRQGAVVTRGLRLQVERAAATEVAWSRRPHHGHSRPVSPRGDGGGGRDEGPRRSGRGGWGPPRSPDRSRDAGNVRTETIAFRPRQPTRGVRRQRSGGADRFPATSAHTLSAPATCRWIWSCGDHLSRHVRKDAARAAPVIAAG